MAKNKYNLENYSSIENVDIVDFLDANGIEYANYVIQSRALVGEDGLKPVNRRILFDMYDLGLKPGSKKTKASRISGDVMGRFHPHGNSSIDGALALLGQEFNTRVPLLEYQGSLGISSGDTPAATRYWEAALSPAGWELVKDLKENAAQMVWTETGEEKEPLQLPIGWSPSLINGSQGIAVGYSASIPPHNPDEVMDACEANLLGKLNTPEDVLQFIKGPDLPTGGIVLGLDGVRDYITTGSGTFIMRGKYRLEDLSRNRKLITFYEIPYQVSPESIKVAIEKAQDKGKFSEISEVKDLTSGEEGIKLSIYLKAGSNVENVIDDLWKNTPLESKFSVNSTILLNGRPNMNTNYLTLINQFTEHKKSCYIRKTEFKIEKLNKELHKNSGLLKVLLDIDKAIFIIRNADKIETAKEKLQKQFKIDEEQSNHILAMQLRSLTKSDKVEIETKVRDLTEELKRLNAILANENLLIEELIKELRETKKVISSPRRTEIVAVTNEELEVEAKEKAKVEKLLAKGTEVFIHFNNNKIFKSLEEPSNIQVDSNGNIFIVTEEGNLVELLVQNIPLDNEVELNELNSSKSKAVGISVENFNTFIVSPSGDVNVIKSGYKAGLFVRSNLIFAKPITTEDSVILVTDEGKGLRLELDKINPKGQGSATIKGITLNESTLVGAELVNEEDLLVTETNETIKFTLISECIVKGRGAQGYLIHKLGASEGISRIRKEAVDKQPISKKGKAGIKRGNL